MMISPMAYRNKQKYKTLKMLIAERNRLLRAIRKYEMENICCLIPKMSNVIKSPSPKTAYSMHNEYLIQITELINKKMQKCMWVEKE